MSRSVLLLHAGIADRRMWAPQLELLEGAGYDVIAPDLRGFGETPLDPVTFSYVRDVAGLLDGPAAVVGASLGGRVALELAVLHPELVDRLVVIAPGLPGWSWSEDTRAGWAAEESAFERGDLDAAAEAALRLWIDGPRRQAADVDPTFRSTVRTMILRSYELQRTAWDDGAEEDELDPPVSDRLGAITTPTLVIVGEHDVSDMTDIAGHVARTIAGARLVEIPGASHLPSLERPELVDPILLAFLDGAVS